MSNTNPNLPPEDAGNQWALSFGGWVRRSPLLLRLAIASTFVFLAGFSGRFDQLGLLLLLLTLMLAAFVWAGFAAFSKTRGLTRDGDTNRWIRVGVWVLSPLLLAPLVAFGQSAALTVAPWTETELAEFAAAEAAAIAEQEAGEAEEQARIEAERAAEEEARRQEEALQIERGRIEKIVQSVIGLTEDEASQLLQSESIDFTVAQTCQAGEEGTVVGAEVDGLNDFRASIFVSTGPTEIPDVIGVVEGRARQLIESACYSVEIKQYYTTESAQEVVAVEPSPGTILEAGETVTIMSSKAVVGETRSEDSVGRWSYLGPTEEDWSFRGPFELDGRLYIPIEAAFSTDMSWRDDYDTGEGFGTAVIIDEFNKEVPVAVQYGKRTVPAGESQNFTAVVPLTDLDDQTPTKVYLYLAVEVDGSNRNLTAEFTMTW